MKYSVAYILLFSLFASSALGVTITFEAFPGPDGKLGTGDDIPITAPIGFIEQPEQLTTQFVGEGIVFVPDPPLDNMNEILNDSSWFRTVGSSPNLLSTSRSSHPPFGKIEAEFILPGVRELTMAIGLPYHRSPSNLLEVFDAAGALIGSAVGYDEFVTISTSVDIRSFRVTAVTSGHQATIDDITFIPEPTTVFLLGLCGLALFRKRKRQ